MPKLGFEFRESMTGTWTAAGKPGDERPVRVTLHAVADDALAHLKDGLTQVVGTIEIAGLAEEAAVGGVLEIALLRKRIIRYDLGFVGDDGKPYRLQGQKDIRLADLPGTMTTLPAEIRDAGGQTVGKALVRFDLRSDLLTFLASWKPRISA